MFSLGSHEPNNVIFGQLGLKVNSGVLLISHAKQQAKYEIVRRSHERIDDFGFAAHTCELPANAAVLNSQGHLCRLPDDSSDLIGRRRSKRRVLYVKAIFSFSATGRFEIYDYL